MLRSFIASFDRICLFSTTLDVFVRKQANKMRPMEGRTANGRSDGRTDERTGGLKDGRTDERALSQQHVYQLQRNKPKLSIISLFWRL